MRSTLLITSLAALALVSVACSSGQGVRVTTSEAPDANLTGLHTFRVLDAPQRSATAPTLPADDPMLSNSITNQQLRGDLTQALEQKGFTQDQSNPDFLVAYYAGTKAKMDTTYWAPDYGWRYGYRGYGFRGSRFRSAWPWYGYASPSSALQVQEYTQGSVIVDVIDPKTMELLWRGQGVANVSDNTAAYEKELDQSVVAILKKFPSAT
jgi:hypothetical protein